MDKNFIAHYRESDGLIQPVTRHLKETAELTELFAAAIGLPLCGRLLGLCHDLGKYSEAFQVYIREGCGFYGEEGRQRAKAKVGTIDHATAGAQHVWNTLASGKIQCSLAQILSVALMSHHSRTGMKDFIALDGKSPFLDRLNTQDERTHLAEALVKADLEILSEINQLLSNPELLTEFRTLATRIEKSSPEKVIRFFNYSLLARFLFSCLLDADRLNTADFEKLGAAAFRTTGIVPNWEVLTGLLETHLKQFGNDTAINQIRKAISDECRDAASRPERLFTLPVPTGGGKTLASLRFALHRATQSAAQAIERIIYIIPYTSIIDQNAKDVREVLGAENVLEHHSNIAPEIDTWRNRVLSENWDAPVVFTTSVQLLDALFNQSTSSARRMHQLANSILIFDEIQTLPVKTIHCFNNAINFLTSYCNTTVLLCTATMPLLDQVNPSLGALPLTPACDLITDKKNLFQKLKRTKIIDSRRAEKWTHQQIRDFSLKLVSDHQSVLVVCNTKNSAQRLYQLLLEAESAPKIVHLSTSMCPAHRKNKIDEIRADLNPGNLVPVICVSTQLIEAGVDLDFGCVIRSLAGMDSIIQAGGRCNRHGTRNCGSVYILNFAEEPLGTALQEIANTQQDSERVLDEFSSDPKRFDEDLLSEATMDQFYQYHFFKRAGEMLYPLKGGNGKPPIAADTSILDLLSENHVSLESANREKFSEISRLPLQQAYSTAAQAFEVIDAPTRGIIVPYDNDATGHEGSKLIADLAAAFSNDEHPLREQVQLLKQAQQFTVNAFPHVIKKLDQQGAIREVQPESGIYYLDERHYHKEFGVTLEALSEQNYYEIQP